MNNILLLIAVGVTAYVMTELYNIADGLIAKWQIKQENKRFYAELNKRVKRIKRYNRHDLIENNIKPFIREQFFQVNNVYPSDKYLEKLAVSSFKQAKALGYIDCLNAKRL